MITKISSVQTSYGKTNQSRKNSNPSFGTITHFDNTKDLISHEIKTILPLDQEIQPLMDIITQVTSGKYKLIGNANNPMVKVGEKMYLPENYNRDAAFNVFKFLSEEEGTPVKILEYNKNANMVKVSSPSISGKRIEIEGYSASTTEKDPASKMLDSIFKRLKDEIMKIVDSHEKFEG